MDEYVGKYYTKKDVFKRALRLTDDQIKEKEKEIAKELSDGEENQDNQDEGQEQ